MYITRVGIGYDVHRLRKAAEGGFVPICGIKLLCDYTVEAHSDGDVGLHALTDAILGAIANGNIGSHFPATDEKWCNKESKFFVQYANELVEKIGGQITNIDITIICEYPKVMPKSLEMRQFIADILVVNLEQVSVKATTTEKMVFFGRQEGIAAQAICSILIHNKFLK
ncbi:MAG: 2-C-methyl-D-erythritol 2,4-cyclodiphosphate synthase [Candidatus Midichloria sp.]|nr:MAG: 2-C-methyl-D-erythritol 2,4-cyclodiphosphate synthase [Candidatus Midichloria sp.]